MSRRSSRPVMVIVGTRPEAIKMAPVVFALRESTSLRPILVSTGQHKSMLDQGLRAFGLRPDHDLAMMKPGQSLEDLTARLIPPLTSLCRRRKPAAVLVQGDTTTTFAAALAAFYAGVPVGHVEAGLRTFDPRSPFPEEVNRRLTDQLSEWLFAPTRHAARTLRAEGFPARRILTTGNTGVDALLWTLDNAPVAWPAGLEAQLGDDPVILVTAHRRESFGEPLDNLFRAIREIVDREPGVRVVYPVHLNPNVRRSVDDRLRGHPRIHLIEPVSYPEMVTLLGRCRMVLTDSGGLQEEAPTLGKPVLVTRATTERPEGLDEGTSILVGTDPGRVIAACRRLLRAAPTTTTRRRRNPFGDGRAAARILARLERDLARA
ncbi:MAG: UDP-N-acetylglucosamine 2-epimerase (non-hydrolyzing) [Candidatus Eisenbacteria bacterium]|nr:UDP-N-acetylglucosamine 2-epimerase (non-hydrolyzing) [Candidatus Eisenbacteria bacterium]